MARKTKALSGEGARRYFKALFAAELPRDPGAADRLTATCVREIAELRVRMPLVSRRVVVMPTDGAEPSGAASAPENAVPVAPVAPVAPQDEGPVAGPLASPVPNPAPSPVPSPVAAPVETAAAATESPAEAFDPHAFSLVVALRRDGRDALLARLTAVADVGRLRQIARAQHVSLAKTPDDASLETLCLDIVAGTERRIAHREAAAS